VTSGPAARRGRRARRGIVIGLGVALAAILGAGWVAVAGLGPRELPAGWPPADGLAEYTGVIHVHSERSHDGRGTLEEIAGAAARAGARVVFLTDHNTLGALTEGREGWYGPTLILVGAEVTTGSGYLLVLDPPRDAIVRARGYALGDLLQRWRDAGALVVLAHPEHPRLGWRDEVPPVDGLEVVDVFDQVVGAPLHRQALGLLAYPANPLIGILSVIHWPRPVLGLWDRLARARPTFGVLALDAHGGIALTEETGIRFPSHETAFRIGQLHFVTDEPLGFDVADRTRVYRALRRGRFYNAFDGFAPAAGFRFHVVAAGGHRALLGDRVPFREGLEAEIQVPPAGETVVRLVADGAVVHEARGGQRLRVPVRAPGVYRVEVDLRASLFPVGPDDLVPWIYSNPIYVDP
jgi:hypothetical protein